MKKQYWILLVLFSAAILLPGCPTQEVRKDNVQNEIQQPANAPLPDTSDPEWSKKTIQVTGQGAVNPAHAGNPAQAELMAKRAAITDARRNLLEQVLGVRIDSQTVIKDMVAQSDDLKAQVEGLVKETSVIGQNFSNNIYTVNMELKMYNIYTYMKTQKIYYK